MLNSTEREQQEIKIKINPNNIAIPTLSFSQLEASLLADILP